MVVRLDDDRARFDGRAVGRRARRAWDDLELDALLEDRDEYDTVGGLVFHRIGGVPKPGDVVERRAACTITVETTDGRRVGKVLVVAQRRADGGRTRRRRTAEAGRRAPRAAASAPGRLRADDAAHDLLELARGPPAATTPAASSSAIASSRQRRASARV